MLELKRLTGNKYFNNINDYKQLMSVQSLNEDILIMLLENPDTHELAYVLWETRDQQIKSL